MKKRIFEIIEASRASDVQSKAYDIFMMAAILLSIAPLAFKVTPSVFDVIEPIVTFIFIADYLVRWWTADFKLNKGCKSYLLYPFTLPAVIDLVAILPGFRIVDSCFRLFKIFRLTRVLRVFRAFKLFRYSKNVEILVTVIKTERYSLIAVFILALVYILLCALIVFNIEPQTFDNIWEAIYWATISMTTVGYGDIYPVTAVGRFITMLSALIGIAIVAMPASVITAGYMRELARREAVEENDEA